MEDEFIEYIQFKTKLKSITFKTPGLCDVKKLYVKNIPTYNVCKFIPYNSSENTKNVYKQKNNKSSDHLAA